MFDSLTSAHNSGLDVRFLQCNVDTMFDIGKSLLFRV
jgi:hypothetical protein